MFDTEPVGYTDNRAQICPGPARRRAQGRVALSVCVPVPLRPDVGGIRPTRPADSFAGRLFEAPRPILLGFHILYGQSVSTTSHRVSNHSFRAARKVQSKAGSKSSTSLCPSATKSCCSLRNFFCSRERMSLILFLLIISIPIILQI